MDVLWSLRLRTMDARFRFGFDDPMPTGLLCGAAAALTGVPRPAWWSLHVEPDFTGSTLTGSVRLRWSVRPSALVWPIVTFVSSPVSWRAAWGAVQQR